MEEKRELDERKLRRIIDRYERRVGEFSVKPQSLRSFMIGRHRLSKLLGNVIRLRRVNPRLAKGLGKVVEDYRNYRITYPKAKKIIEERLRKAGLEWKD